MTLKDLERLNNRLLSCATLSDKIAILSPLPAVVDYLSAHAWMSQILTAADLKTRLVIYQLLVLNQGTWLNGESQEALDQLVARLLRVDQFYAPLGGLIGYHLTVCHLMKGGVFCPYAGATDLQYTVPRSIDLRRDSLERRKAILSALRHLPETAYFFAVGGAGDRLNLHDPETGQALPAACLQFGGGGCLLDLLMRDVQALEFLHEKLFGKSVVCPIVLMTSEEKNNHQQLVALCEERRWFNRPRDSFVFLIQPQVPVVTEIGIWANEGPFAPILKPGGHGVIWKLAKEKKVFEWLQSHGCRKALVRQINNPVAGTDYGLLSFLGIGWQHDKAFGFASCDRRLNAPEGMDILVQTRDQGRYQYRLTNVEYTDFAKRGIKDQAVNPGSAYSVFPSNTNILFLDIQAVAKAMEQTPLPGMLVNMKSRFPVTNAAGERVELPGGRLEGTMQNVADYIVDTWDHPWDGADALAFSTYITFNERHKTLGTIKNGSSAKEFIEDTPESCWYGILRNHWELFTEYCKVLLPAMPSREQFIAEGPSFVIQLHPGLGPLYGVTSQKIRGGELAQHAHLVLEIAELVLIDLHLDGSLQVRCTVPLSSQNGKCTLRGVTVRNRGMDRQGTQNYWSGAIALHESLDIRIQGDGEFFAENVIFNGPLQVEVLSGERVVASQDAQGNVKLERTKLKGPSWCWDYSVDAASNIIVGIF